MSPSPTIVAIRLILNTPEMTRADALAQAAQLVVKGKPDEIRITGVEYSDGDVIDLCPNDQGVLPGAPFYITLGHDKIGFDYSVHIGNGAYSGSSQTEAGLIITLLDTLRETGHGNWIAVNADTGDVV